MNSVLISQPKVAKKGGVCVKTIRNRRNDPKLNFPKAILIRGRVYFWECEIDEFYERSKTPG